MGQTRVGRGQLQRAEPADRPAIYSTSSAFAAVLATGGVVTWGDPEGAGAAIGYRAGFGGRGGYLLDTACIRRGPKNGRRGDVAPNTRVWA